MKKIGERIKLERKRLGLTQKDFLLKIYMSETSTATLRRWEQGKDLPDLKTLVYMAELFDCDIGYLIADYNERRRISTDICLATGLSEIAVNSLMQFKDSPISCIAKRKNGQMYFLSPQRIISALLGSKQFKRFIDQLNNYLRFSGDIAEKIKNDEDFSTQDPGYRRTINYFWGQGYEIISRQKVAEMYLQSAADTLKVMYQEIHEEIMEGTDNVTEK